MPRLKKSQEDKLARLTPAQKAELDRIELEAIAHFEGQLDDLESALGMLRMGHHFGWKVLYIIHSKATIRKYERILDIKIRDVFPETGPSSYRSLGYQIVQKVSNFWKFVSGEAPEAKELDRDERRMVRA
jgi:hypothetical protein